MKPLQFLTSCFLAAVLFTLSACDGSAVMDERNTFLDPFEAAFKAHVCDDYFSDLASQDACYKAFLADIALEDTSGIGIYIGYEKIEDFPFLELTSIWNNWITAYNQDPTALEIVWIDRISLYYTEEYIVYLKQLRSHLEKDELEMFEIYLSDNTTVTDRKLNSSRVDPLFWTNLPQVDTWSPEFTKVVLIHFLRIAYNTHNEMFGKIE